MKNTLVIFGGFNDGATHEFRWNRQDCDIWVFNEAVSNNTRVPWCSAVFQMHRPAIFRNPNNRNDQDHYQWLQSNDAIPVYMEEKYAEIPMSIEYPLDAVIGDLLPHLERPANEVWADHGGYFSSSLDYMLALGIYNGYRRIELWGIGLARGTEYYYQRPGAFFWTGIALGRGIEVYIHSHIFDAPLYGYSDIYIPLNVFETRKAALEKQLEPIQKQFDEAQSLLMDTLNRFKLGKVNGKHYQLVVEQHGKALQELSRMEGFLAETERYIDKARTMMDASGDNDFRFSRQEFEDMRLFLMTEIARVKNDRASSMLKVERAYSAIPKAVGQLKRMRAVDTYIRAFDEDNANVSKLAMWNARATENYQYMQILDQQYLATGGQKAIEMLAAVKE